MDLPAGIILAWSAGCNSPPPSIQPLSTLRSLALLGTYREFVDSREGFSAAEEAEYHADTVVHDKPTDADYEEACDYFDSLDDDDGQPDEY